MERIKKTAPWLVVLSGVFWGSMGVFVRTLNGYGIMAIQVVEIRAAIATIAIAIVILCIDSKLFRIKLKDIWCFLGTGIVGIVLFNICYFTTIQNSSLSIAAILLYTAPIFVIFISAPLFKEKITVIKVLSMLIAFAGCILVCGIGSGGSTLTPKGLLIGILSGVGYAMYTVFNRYAINKGYNPLTIQFYTFLCGAIGGGFICDFGQISHGISMNPFGVIMLMIATALVTTAIPNVLYTFAMKHVDNGKTAVMASIEPVTATIFGILVFKEIPTVWGFVGMLLVIGALFLINVNPKNKNA